jgi:ribosomal protein S18 acetylase RimI-like enzyme
VRIERATQATDELVEALRRLIPQLSRTADLPTREELADVVARGDTYLLVARDRGGGIVGSLTLVIYRIPTRLQGTIQDVVVDEAARGQGVGEALTREAQRIAVAEGASVIRLTSRSHRQAAHRLYERLGFELVDTNAYAWRPEARER